MKIAIIMGTRPEIIRLYHTVKIIPNKKIFWTGQNFEKNLSDDIFNDPLLRDAYNNVVKLSTGNSKSFYSQIGSMIYSLFVELAQYKPDKILILGDTNTSLAGAIVAKKMGIPLYHMEAGNRCYNPNSPEEVNRKLIDSIADVHMCYTEHAKKNLLAEGVPQNYIHVIGNPIAEFSILHNDNIRYGSSKYKYKEYVLITCHRQENRKYIKNLIKALQAISKYINVVACIHPRFYDYFKDYPEIECIPSTNFSNFVELQRNAKVVVTDSGTVCEEAAILGVPCVIIRETMERPELFDYGTCILSGISREQDIEEAIIFQLSNNYRWSLPEEYKYNSVSRKVINILKGKANYVITP